MEKAPAGVAEHVQADGEHQEGAQELAGALLEDLGLGALAKEAGADELGENGGHGGAQQLEEDVEEAAAEVAAGAREVDGDGDGGVEAAAGDGACSVGAGDDHEADGEAVVHGVASGGGVEDHEAQHEGVQELGDGRVEPAEVLAGAEREGGPVEGGVQEAGANACRDPRRGVLARSGHVHAAGASHAVRDVEAKETAGLKLALEMPPSA